VHPDLAQSRYPQHRGCHCEESGSPLTAWVRYLALAAATGYHDHEAGGLAEQRASMGDPDERTNSVAVGHATPVTDADEGYESVQ
jgi:hypothetical protein